MSKFTLLLLALLVGTPAYTAPVASLDVQRFTLSGSYHSFLTVPTGQILPKKKFGFDVALDFGVLPLQRTDAALARMEGVIDFLFALHVRGGFAFSDWAQIDVQLPLLQLAATGPAILNLVGERQVASLGDLWITGRFAPLREGKHPLNLAVEPFLTLPTGNPKLFLTSGLPTFGLRVAASKHWGRLRLAGSFGYRLKPSYAAVGQNVAADDELMYALGVGVAAIPDKLLIHAELTGAGIVGPGLGTVPGGTSGAVVHSPLELLIDARLRLAKGIDVYWGAGPGLTAGVGTPALRVVAGVGWAPSFDRDGDGLVDAIDKCPDEKEDEDGFEDSDGCPDVDNDGDGIADGVDACPLEPEDKDRWEDTDGCIDPDNDGDGLKDGADKCPNEKEDLDAFHDTDGCPDRDNDGDGIEDIADRCPLDPEDVDGWQDSDGCAEPDNDGDGLLDGKDLCPNDPETKNGTKDEDGCPDETMAVVRGDKLVILEKVLFVNAKDTILKRSFPLLDFVTRTLIEHPELKKVRVEGRTDSVGNDGTNQVLSEKRATAVMRYLVKAGVDPERLLAVGYGEARPVDSNDTDDGRERNRRVEFTILESGAR